MNQVGIGSDSGLSTIRHQAISWTIDGLLTIGPLGTNFSDVVIIKTGGGGGGGGEVKRVVDNKLLYAMILFPKFMVV